MAAIGIPLYQDYAVKAKLSAVVSETQAIRDTLGSYYEENQEIPESLEELKIQPQLGSGAKVSLDQEGMVLTVSTPQGDLVFAPSVDSNKHIIWHCSSSESIKPTQLPASCKQ